MGSKQSTASSKTTTVEMDEDLKYRLEIFRMSKPTAAVIGAGLSGLHCAAELANLGFQVTVIDQRSEIGSGATQFSRPFVGLGLSSPAMYDVPLAKDLLRGLFPMGVPDMHSTDHAISAFISRRIHRWMYDRYWYFKTTGGKPHRDDILKLSSQLSQNSKAVVEQYMQKYPELKAHVVEGAGRLQAAASVTSSDKLQSKGETADSLQSDALFIDPLGWTTTLASALQKHHQVEFALNRRVSPFESNYRHSTEYISYINLIPPGGDIKMREPRKFDLVVLAADAGTNDLLQNVTTIPLVGLGGVSISAGNTHPLMKKIHSVFRVPKGAMQLVDVATSSGVAAYPSPGDRTKRTSLNGLFSLDPMATVRAVGSLEALQTLEAPLRVKANLEVASKEWAASPNPPAEDASNTDRVVAATYVRAFTPDGLPIVGRVRDVYNLFVCTGFGDHAPDFAPAAARLLADEVVARKPECVNEEQHTLRMPSTPYEGDAVARDFQAARQVVNPFRLDRFGARYLPNQRMVADPDDSWVRRVTCTFEPKLLAMTDPLRRKMNRTLTDFARRDGVPWSVRDFIFYYFYAEEDFEGLVTMQSKQHELETRLADKH